MAIGERKSLGKGISAKTNVIIPPNKRPCTVEVVTPPRAQALNPSVEPPLMATNRSRDSVGELCDKRALLICGFNYEYVGL